MSFAIISNFFAAASPSSSPVRRAFHVNKKTGIIALLTTFIAGSGRIVSGAAGLLTNLGRHAFVVLGIALVSCSTSFLIVPAVTRCRRSGCKNASSRMDILSTALKFGGNLATLRLVERYIDDPGDAMNTLSILQTMTAADDHILHGIAEMGGIETTVKALKRFGEDNEGVAASGCGLLKNFCIIGRNGDRTDSDDDNSNKTMLTHRRVMECGGITTLVQVMRHWPDSEQVQANSCAALEQLALLPAACSSTTSSSGRDSCGDDMTEIQKKIVDVGGLVALAEARTKHQHDARVRDPADRALMALIQH